MLMGSVDGWAGAAPGWDDGWRPLPNFLPIIRCRIGAVNDGRAGTQEGGESGFTPRLSGFLRTWGDGVLAEGVGFEPTVSCPTAVFKTAAFNHSATLPVCFV